MTMLPVSPFADAIADTVAGGVGGGAVRWRKGMCDLGSFVVGDDDGSRCGSALWRQCVSLRVVEE